MPGSWLYHERGGGNHGADPCVVMLFVRGLFGACEREPSQEDLPLVGPAGNAVRTHSLKTAVEGQGTSYHPGWLLCHFGPGMGPPLTNVQLEGGVVYIVATAGDFHPPPRSAPGGVAARAPEAGPLRICASRASE